MHQGLAAWRATGAEMGRPYFLALLAEAYGKAGQGEEGLTVLAEALAAVDKTGERVVRGGAVSAERGANAPDSRSVQSGSNGKEKSKSQPLNPHP